MNLRPDPDLTREFCALISSPVATEWGAAVLVNRVIYPGMREASLQSLIATDARPAEEAPWTFLSRLGFQGEADALRNLDNSCVSRVIDRRRGLPITLALVLIELARSEGRQAWGLNTPGHFLAWVDGQVIDPVQMSPLPLQGELPRASVADIALRMLNNIKHACLEQRHPHSALVVIEHQRGIAAALENEALVAGLHLEAGNCWFALNHAELAREEYETCLALSQEGSEVARNAAMRLQLLSRAAPPTLH